MNKDNSGEALPFESVKPKIDFIELEKRVLERWNSKDILRRYLHRNDASDRTFSFIDGPITANNPMGVHHAWGRFYKDVFQRFRNMQGYRQRFQNGFDGQGLWVEVEVERARGFTSKKDIESYGIDRFVEECKLRVLNFADKITEQSKRLGYFMDWDNSYHTMSDENNYAIWGFLKHCHEKGWLYEGRDVMPWCPRCGTGLSQHEIVTDGYREVEHPGLFVMLRLAAGEASFLVWTTTPWTLAANVAVAVNPDSDYVKVRNSWKTSGGLKEEYLWLSERRLKVLKGEWSIVERAKGSELVALLYNGPFDEFDAQEEAREMHHAIPWSYVSEDEGTGIVHIAPGAGAEDFHLGQEWELPVISALTDDGRYLDGFGFLSGRRVDEVKDDIYADLRRKGTFYRLERYRHRYPFCWRCGEELVFRLVSEWFISMDGAKADCKDDGLRPRMIEATKRMKWIPSFGKERELDWLQNMHDWMISKKRYWGLALPIFKCEECGHVTVIGSKEELRQHAVKGWQDFDGHSPHRPWIDSIRIKCGDCGKLVPRIKDVGNPWLDAGIVGFSTLHYYKDKSYWQEWFPAKWISESFPGQFRNWFYSLIAMSVALEDIEPAELVFSYALMRDEKGEEMHKSRGNAIWFEEAADTIGVDVMRWLFSRQNPSANLNFGYKPCDELRKRFIIPLWNVYSFFVTYARLDGWTADQSAAPRRLSQMDRWILAEMNLLIEKVTEAMENWRIEVAARRIEAFVDVLSNWYVRRSRRRFWKSEYDEDKRAAYSTLYECLTVLSLLTAPIMPFLADEIYRNLVSERVTSEPDSVHLKDWPKPREEFIDAGLIEQMQAVIRIVSMGRSARARAGIKIRQPLLCLGFYFAGNDDSNNGKSHALDKDALEQIEGELNIKAAVAKHSSDTSWYEMFKPFLNRLDSVEETRVQITSIQKGEMLFFIKDASRVTLKPNYKTLMPKYGHEVVKVIAEVLGNADADMKVRYLEKMEKGEGFMLGDEDEAVDGRRDIVLHPEDVEFEVEEGYGVRVLNVAGNDGWNVALLLEITPELRSEGWAREVIRRIQNLRKSADLEIVDRVRLRIEADDDVVDNLRDWLNVVTRETLADQVFCELGTEVEHYPNSDSFMLDGRSVVISLEKI